MVEKAKKERGDLVKFSSFAVPFINRHSAKQIFRWPIMQYKCSGHKNNKCFNPYTANTNFYMQDLHGAYECDLVLKKPPSRQECETVRHWRQLIREDPDTIGLAYHDNAWQFLGRMYKSMSQSMTTKFGDCPLVIRSQLLLGEMDDEFGLFMIFGPCPHEMKHEDSCVSCVAFLLINWYTGDLMSFSLMTVSKSPLTNLNETTSVWRKERLELQERILQGMDLKDPVDSYCRNPYCSALTTQHFELICQRHCFLEAAPQKLLAHCEKCVDSARYCSEACRDADFVRHRRVCTEIPRHLLQASSSKTKRPRPSLHIYFNEEFMY